MTLPLTLIWDLDDVLNDQTRLWLERSWCVAHPDKAVTYDELTENPPHRILGVTREEYLASMDEFRASSAGVRLRVPDEVTAWFRSNGRRARHVVVTACPQRFAADRARWVYENLGPWMCGVHVVPSPRPGDTVQLQDRTKSDWLRWFGRSDAVLIDDAPEYISAARNLSMRAIVVPHPWNGASGTRADALRQIDSLLDDDH